MSHARASSSKVAVPARVVALTVSGMLMLGVAAPAPAVAATSTTERREAVLYYTNKARKAKGCGKLEMSRRLTRSAQRHASDMSERNYFGHTSLSGRTWDQRIRAAGYSEPGGENIAYGFKSARYVVRAWMISPSHRRNILTCSFKKLGVGYARDGGIWVQDFGY
jgi:uncharacterized protein YkwD